MYGVDGFGYLLFAFVVTIKGQWKPQAYYFYGNSSIRLINVSQNLNSGL